MTDFAIEAYEQLQAVSKKLDEANGKRRTRTLGHNRTLIDGDVPEIYLGGHVANAYGYAAVQTVMAIVEVDGLHYAQVIVANAKRGSTGFGNWIRGGKLTKSSVNAVVESWQRVPSWSDASVAADWFEENGEPEKAAWLREWLK